MWRRLGEGLQPLRKDEEERLRRVFDRIDKNADGYAHQRRPLLHHVCCGPDLSPLSGLR